MPATLDMVMQEVRALRRVQEEILALLRAGGGAPAPSSTAPRPAPRPLGLDDDEAGETGAPAAGAPTVRSRRRKTLLLIDDDPATRDAARAALERVEVPVRVVGDGNAALGAIAAEKPDVIAMELDMAGDMSGKDVINMIKATMEWVDIPIVLYTRMQVESQKEARQVHGADEFVIKGANGPEQLVQRVIALFRKV